MKPGLSFGVLGPLEVRHGDNDITPTAPRQRAILAALLLRAGEVVSTDRLIDAVWGETPPATARSALSVHITQLRRSLGEHAELLQTRRPGYVITVDSLDAARFEELVTAARAAVADGDLAAAIRSARTAEGLWRGPAYADFEYDDFASAESRRLTELRRATTVQRLDAQLALGEHLEVVGELHTLTEESPGDQQLWAQLMLALYRSGRQQDALHAYRRAADGLAELGLEPLARLRRLEEQILLEDPDLDARLPTPRAREGNLPLPRSSFVGRHTELTGLGKLIGEHRLVTVTGPGGVGKTRLALEVGQRHQTEYPAGIWLVDLGTAHQPDEIEAAWADALGTSDQATASIGGMVAARLSGDPALIIVDNVEHITEVAATAIGDVLDRCPSVRVVATGRSNLALPGEAVLPLTPMAFPTSDSPPEQLSSDSVRLLIDRASALGSKLDADEAPLLGEICRRLDGLPLAVELAAVHVATLGARVIYDRLEAGLGLPESDRHEAPVRQRTLWSTMTWSYELLAPAERALFRRMGVFAGSPDLAAITAVGSFDEVRADQAPALLATLIRNSMILKVGAARDRTGFAMLDTIREFARAKLEETDELTVTTQRHHDHFLELAVNGPQRVGGTHQAWYQLFSANRLDFALAISASFDSDARRAAGGYQSLAMFCNDTGRAAEARALTSRALARVDELGDEHRGTLLQAAGQVAFFSSDWRLASQRLVQALEMRRRVGEPHQICATLNALGVALIRSPRFEEAREHFREALHIAEGLGEPMVESAPLTNLGISYLLSGPTEAGASHLERALQRQRDSKDEMSASIATSWLAIDSWLRGDLRHAIELYDEAIAANRRFDAKGFLARNLALRSDVVLELAGPTEEGSGLLESLDLYEETGRRLHYAELIENCGFYAAAIKQPEVGAELLGAADGLRGRQGITEPVWNRLRRQHIDHDLRAELGVAGSAAAHRRGSLRSATNVAALIRHVVAH